MNIADNLHYAGIAVPPELERKFDSALLGYLVRHDTFGVAAYQEELYWKLELSMPLKTETDPDIMLVESIPNYAVFGQHLDKGMITWEALNTAIIGFTVLPKGYCAVYSYEKALQVLMNTFVDSSAVDISKAVKLYFETEILKADFGPRSPFFLMGGNHGPAVENGLGQKAVLELPSGRRGINGYIDKTNGYSPPRDRDVQVSPPSEAEG